MSRPKADWTLPFTYDDKPRQNAARARWDGLTEDQKEVERRSQTLGLNGQDAAHARQRFYVCTAVNPGQPNEAALASITLDWWDVFERFIKEGWHRREDWREFRANEPGTRGYTPLK